MAEDDNGPSDEEIKLILGRHQGMALKNLPDNALAKRPLTKAEIDNLLGALILASGGFYDVWQALKAIINDDKMEAIEALGFLEHKMRDFEASTVKLAESLERSLLFEDPDLHG